MDLELVTVVDAENPIIGDLRLVDGQLSWLGADPTDPDDYTRMVAQRCRCRLLFFRGEWYQDQNLGTPWRERLLGTGITSAAAARIFRRVIESAPGVAEVTKLEVELDGATRVGTLTFEARTDVGTIVTVEMIDLPFIITPQEVDHG